MKNERVLDIQKRSHTATSTLAREKVLVLHKNNAFSYNHEPQGVSTRKDWCVSQREEPRHFSFHRARTDGGKKIVLKGQKPTPYLFYLPNLPYLSYLPTHIPLRIRTNKAICLVKPRHLGEAFPKKGHIKTSTPIPSRRSIGRVEGLLSDHTKKQTDLASTWFTIVVFASMSESNHSYYNQEQAVIA